MSWGTQWQRMRRSLVRCCRRGDAQVAKCQPLELPVRRTADGIEICRFHNYSPAGCIRVSQGRCPLDHHVCHWCGEEGHAPLACDAQTGGSGTPAAGTEAAAPRPLLARPVPFLYALGGRLRGRTLVSCERLSLEQCRPAAGGGGDCGGGACQRRRHRPAAATRHASSATVVCGPTCLGPSD